MEWQANEKEHRLYESGPTKIRHPRSPLARPRSAGHPRSGKAVGDSLLFDRFLLAG